MSVARCQQEVDSREFSEWMAYYRIDPWGEERADLRSGTICAVLANINSARGKSFKPGDFMFSESKKSRWQPVDQQRATLLAFSRAHNAALEPGQKT